MHIVAHLHEMAARHRALNGLTKSGFRPAGEKVHANPHAGNFCKRDGIAQGVRQVDLGVERCGVLYSKRNASLGCFVYARRNRLTENLSGLLPCPGAMSARQHVD